MQNSPEVEDGTYSSPCRSRLKRSLSVCATLGLFLTVGLSMSVLISNNQRANTPKIVDSQTSVPKKPNAKSDDSICVTPGCVLAAAELLQNMDKNINPCDDFYSFACGGFQAKNRITEDVLRVNYFTMLKEKVTDQLHFLIEKPIKKDEAEPFKLVKTFYRSCMNSTLDEEKKLERVKKILQEFGGWPVVEGEKWNDKNFVWDEMIYKMKRAGYLFGYFIHLSVEIDYKNSTSRVITLQVPPISKLNQENLNNLTIKLGADKETALKQLTEVFELENNLTKIKPSLEEKRDVNKRYNSITIKELKAKVPGISWLKYINNILAPYHVVTENEKVFVLHLDHLLKTADLIVKTSKRTLANYMMSGLLDFCKQSWAQSDWKVCTDVVAKSFKNTVGAMYVREYFDEDARYSANEMVKDIRSVFGEIIDEKSWIDNKTRAHAQNKLAAITPHVGYPVELLDDKKLADLYENLTLNFDDHLGNVLKLNIFQTKQSFKKLREPVNKTDWISNGNSATINPFYSPRENSIQFPAAFLQSVFFGKDRPAYLNYAAIGWVIGHEITHGFDDQGCQFCAKGNLFNWWEQSAKQKYLKLTKCFIDQYDNYTIPEIGIKLNGFITQGENIADNGGIKLAYRAYIKRSSQYKKDSQNWDQVEQRLPGLTEYNVRQLFWLGAANVWCEKIDSKLLKERILNDVHSPNYFRVRGTFANMPQFASDYNCPVGSAMNPVQKCDLW